MLKLKNVLAITLLFVLQGSGAQIVVEGYVYQSGNRGYLNQVKVSIQDTVSGSQEWTTFTDKEGFYTLSVPFAGDYLIRAQKSNFETWKKTVSLAKKKEFVQVEMKRSPGYLFEATLAPTRLTENQTVDAIRGARIEVYNHMSDKLILELRDHPDPEFKVPFEQGNHYTVMIRKEGYLTKRIEAYVNVEGCILCLDGVGEVRPGVSDNLTENNKQGVLLANIELEPVKVGSKFVVDNIYYDFDKSFIRSDAAEQLNNLAIVLRDNPKLIVELGSHTDSRGNDEYNMDLSDARAQSAVDYLIWQGVDSDKITAKGYGESELVNDCGNGVECTEKLHQQNRRTEIKVTGITAFDELAQKTLADIIREEKFLAQAFGGEQIKIEEGTEVPEDLQAYLDRREALTDDPDNDMKPEEDEREKGQRTLSEPLPGNFSGYTLLLTNSKVSLQQLRSIVNIATTVYEYKEDNVSYFVTGDFVKVKHARKALQSIKKRWPQAEVVFFRQGKMIRS